METKATPECVGFIMDGNRRWAKHAGKTSLEGHAAGYEALRTIITAVRKAHIPHMVCYAFSTENWKRTETEVSYLMNLMRRAITELSEEFSRGTEHINVRIIGEVEKLPVDLQAEITRIESKNSAEPALTVWLAISYGGRAEILRAVEHARALEGEITEDRFKTLLWTSAMPDPDLIIRTSGEERLSNFLLWQSAYSELFFTPTMWPDFGESEFQGILEQYATRQRRRGA